MKFLTPQIQADITNAAMGTNFKGAELRKKIKEVKTRLQAQWDETKDLVVYEDPEYVFEAINSFGKSGECVAMMCRYFNNDWGTRPFGSDKSKDRNLVLEKFTGDISKLSVLDVYSGNGLTNTTLALNGFTNVETVGSSTGQLAYQKACQELMLGHELVNHTELPTKTYDVVCTFEVLEHFKEPVPHARDLMNLVAPGGYLCESRGFSYNPNIGHYTEYELNGKIVTPPQVTRAVTKEFQKEFKLVVDCFRKPRIWKRL